MARSLPAFPGPSHNLRVTEAKAIMLVPTFAEADHLRLQNLPTPGLNLQNLPAPGLECSPQLLGMAAEETLVSRGREKNHSSKPEKGVGQESKAIGLSPFFRHIKASPFFRHIKPGASPGSI